MIDHKERQREDAEHLTDQSCHFADVRISVVGARVVDKGSIEGDGPADLNIHGA